MTTSGAPDPWTLAEIEAALRQVGETVSRGFDALPDDVFWRGDDEVWSPAHHLHHLSLSNQPVASALSLPRERLTARDIPPSEVAPPSRTARQIRALYTDALSGGVKASGRFSPVLDGSAQARAEVLAGYQGSIELLMHDLIYWTDPELDAFSLLHPALGPLSVREMLFFTWHHNLHHLHGVQRRAALAAPLPETP